MTQLRLDYTHPQTRAVFPDAVARVKDAKLPALYGSMEIRLGIYVSADAVATGAAPVQELRFILTGSTLDAIRDQFATAVLTILAEDPALAGAVVEEE